MGTTFFIIADAGLSWTPATFFAAAAVVHLLVILLTFRLLGLPAEYNTFIGAATVAIPLNALSYFMRDIDLLYGFLAQAVLLFVLLAMVARGNVLKAAMAGAIVMASYLGMAKVIIPKSEDMVIADLGGITQVLDQGGLEAKGFSEEEFEALSGRKAEN